MSLFTRAALATVLLASATLIAGSAEAHPGRHRHAGPPHVSRPHHHRSGHYETRIVKRWVEGRYERRWIEGVCYRRRHQMRCEPGRYERVWIPGHYVNVSERVWVPHRRWVGRW